MVPHDSPLLWETLLELVCPTLVPIVLPTVSELPVVCPKDCDTLSFQPLLCVVLWLLPQLCEVPVVVPLETECELPFVTELEVPKLFVVEPPTELVVELLTDELWLHPSEPLIPVVVLLESPEDPLITKIPPLIPEVVPSEELLDQPDEPLVPFVVLVPDVVPFDQFEPFDTLEFVPLLAE